MLQWKIKYLEECDSTNTQMQQLLREDPKLQEGFFLRSDSQSGGRGQLDAKWESEPGKNLLASILLRPSGLEAIKNHYLNIMICLSVLETLRGFLHENERHLMKIKWPNDIYFNGKKISGILCENQISGTTINTCIAGIGINVNQQSFSNTKATSLALITSKQQDLNKVMAALMSAVDSLYGLLVFRKFERIERYYYAALWRLEEAGLFQDYSGIFSGKVKGIDEWGRLLVEKENGVVQAYSNKEIIFVTS